MPDAMERPGGWRRLRLTPTSDLLRGRITGRLDWPSNIRMAGFASPVERLIIQVVRRTRLWRIEKVAVASELIAHFQDGLEAGTTADELVRSFGDAKRAAKLIRRAKLRARAIPFRAIRATWRTTKWTVGILLTLYALLAIRFYTGQPHPTVDYIAILNAKTLQTPESNRAWPIYRRAILALSDRSNQQQPWSKFVGYNIYGKHWPEIAAWLQAHSSGMALIRQASTRPVFGFVLGPNGSANDPEMGWHVDQSSTTNNVLNHSLISVPLPYLNEIRALSHAVCADIRLAAEQHDASRAEQDVIAVLSLADQLHNQKHFLVDEMVAIGIRANAMAAAGDVLRDQPDLWSDSQLEQLAHRLSIYERPADLITFQGERLFIPDILQRTYTDNGQGDGRLTPVGAKALAMCLAGQDGSEGAFLLQLAPPLIMEVSLPRQDLVKIVNQFMDQWDALAQAPLRQSAQAAWATEKQLFRWHTSLWAQTRYFPVPQLMPAGFRELEMAERQLGNRDGVTTAIALELYHRHHGHYPDALQELVPGLLPQVPADRITGDPVHYRLVDGKPLIYSVGADRVDDGGCILDRHGSSYAAAEWYLPLSDAPKGDWILYPLPRDTSDNE
jgi:hypothetical protein